MGIGGRAFPFLLATLFGVMNGIYIFKPMVIEARLKRLQEEGADVNAIGRENAREAEIAAHNAKAKEAVKLAKEAVKEKG